MIQLIRRHRRALAVACLTAASASFVATSNSVTLATVPISKIDRQVDDAHDELTRASRELRAAEAAVAKAGKLLPPAQARLAKAQADLRAALRDEADALRAVVAAQHLVEVKRKQIAAARERIAVLRGKIAALARQVYIAGGEYAELEVLLESQDPSQFAIQFEAIKNRSRANSSSLAELATLYAELAAKLTEVRQLEATAEAESAKAQARSQDAAIAQAAAAAAKADINALLAQRKVAVTKAESTRAELKKVYLGRLAEQRRLARLRDQQSGFKVPWKGQSQAATQAVRFALRQVGHSYNPMGGTGPTYGCNGFSWRAWHEAGSSWPLLMAQDQSTAERWTHRVRAGAEKPGDLLFWVFHNGTDWRPDVIDHVGIVVDPGKGSFVAAANSRVGVVVGNYKYGHYSDVAAFARVIK